MMQLLQHQTKGVKIMYQVKVVTGDYDALSESGASAGQVIGCFAAESEAAALAAEMADCGLVCKVSAYKLTQDEARRAKLMASFGQVYVPKHVEPAGKWVRT
jgi:hypothetical protein